MMEYRSDFASNGKLRQRYDAIADLRAVGEAAVGLEDVGVVLVAAQPQAGGNVERHLVATVRYAAL
jgi:hypothetical protein